MMTTKETVAQRQQAMPRDHHGQLLCAHCGALALRGWVYLCGSITLATCDAASCQPPPPWFHGIDFVSSVAKNIPLAPALRFQILKRDGYRCRLCGVAARDGENVRLEVDHISPKIDGINNDPSNLWTSALPAIAARGG